LIGKILNLGFDAAGYISEGAVYFFKSILNILEIVVISLLSYAALILGEHALSWEFAKIVFSKGWTYIIVFIFTVGINLFLRRFRI
jgi:hypothetical protein